MTEKDIVIMAAVAPIFLNGIPRQMLEVNGEPILYRLIRLLKEREIINIYITVPKIGFFGKEIGKLEPGIYTNCKEIVGEDKSGMGRFLNFKKYFKNEAIFFYGDVYYTEEAIDIILKDKHNWRWFGRSGASHIGGKTWGEPFAVKADKHVIEKAEELKILHISGALKLKKCICWDLYRYLNNYPLNVHFVKDNWTEINDFTDDFDYPSDYERFIKRQGEKR